MRREEITRYKATVAYDGTYFSGFQIQPKERTVQGEIETALRMVHKDRFTRIHPAGRTDAGAHAKGMVFHFDFLNTIPIDGLFRAINTLLPLDIVLKKLEVVPNDFHARYDAVGKAYTFRIDNNSLHDPFTRDFVYHHSYPMNKEKVETALSVIKGTHDFTSFCSTKTDKTDKIRTIYQAEIKIEPETNEWVFTFYGDGFLYNMIRIIIGTILEIADGRRHVSEMKKILTAKDRNKAGPTISAKGLCLEKVHYQATSSVSEEIL